MNADDGLEDTRWIRGLEGERLPVASCALLPKPEKWSIFCHRRGIENVCRLFSTRTNYCTSSFPVVTLSPSFSWPRRIRRHRLDEKNEVQGGGWSNERRGERIINWRATVAARWAPQFTEMRNGCPDQCHSIPPLKWKKKKKLVPTVQCSLVVHAYRTHRARPLTNRRPFLQRL